MEMYSYTRSDLEDTFDSVKVAILLALIKEDVIKAEAAEEWSRTHTVIVREKSFFRTLTNLWGKEGTKTSRFTILCVKLAWDKALSTEDKKKEDKKDEPVPSTEPNYDEVEKEGDETND